VFDGVLRNPIFVGIWVTTSCLQALIVEFGSVAFAVAKGGLDPEYWAISIGFGMGSLLWQQVVINILFKLGQKYNVTRNNKRKRRAGQQTVEVTH
jgi:P-type Ca2+ transporter type 2B